jgi:hypothetical protein
MLPATGLKIESRDHDPSFLNKSRTHVNVTGAMAAARVVQDFGISRGRLRDYVPI